jgi:uncharacterized membrane protein
MTGDRGSTVPLILVFFLVALLFCGAAVMLSDAFTRQRDLQSICDGAALSAADSADFVTVRGGLAGQDSLPLADVQSAVQDYLDRDPGRAAVAATATIDGAAVTVDCSRRTTLAFSAMFGAGSGTMQRASSTARSPLQ